MAFVKTARWGNLKAAFDRSFSGADAYLAKGRDKDDRPLPGRNTRLIRRWNGDIGVMYHDTVVLSYNKDGSITLNTKGYTTVTTKARMNTYLPIGVQVFQEKTDWFLAFCEFGKFAWDDAKTVYFKDGIKITVDGQVLNHGGEPARTRGGNLKPRPEGRRYTHSCDGQSYYW